MNKVAFTNDTKNTIHIGSKSVRAGETREVDQSMIPEKLKKKAHGLNAVKKAVKENIINPILVLLDETVPNILIAISTKIKGEYKYSLDDLAVLEQAEVAGKTRNGVISGFAEERLRRGNQAQEAEQLVNSLPSMVDEDLTAALLSLANDEGLIALVQAEIDKRHTVFVTEITESSDEDLTAALELYAADQVKVDLVQSEIDKRAKAS